jgi:Domain of unknown function (DUF5658)
MGIMSTKETKMKTIKMLAVLAAVSILTIGSLGAKEIEFSLLETSAAPQPSLFSPEVMTLAASMAPAPASVPVNIVRPRGFSDPFRGERLEKGLFTASLVTLTALNIADYFSTRRALKSSGLVEGNPLMKPFVKNAVLFAAVKAGTTALSVWGMKSLFKRDKTTAWVMTTLSNFLLSYVVSNNMRLVSRARPR